MTTATQTLKKTVNHTFSTRSFAPELAQAASVEFPLSEIVAHAGVQDIDAMTLEEVLSQRVQSLNAVHNIMAMYAFSGLGETDGGRAPLSYDAGMAATAVDLYSLQVKGTNGQTYFCANISLIREGVERLRHNIYGDVEDFARAVQKSLVSAALQQHKPIVFLHDIMEESDKHMLCRADRYLRKNTPTPDMADTNPLARRGGSLYPSVYAENPYYSLS